MIDLRYVKKLIEMLDGSSVDSVEISTEKGMKIRISKTAQQRSPAHFQVPAAAAAAPDASTAGHAALLRATPSEGNSAIADQAEAVARSEPPKSNLIEIKSPMVGTYYAQPEPGATPYATPGQRIIVGQVLCIIEAMKLMNEILSEISGEIVSVLVQNGQPVEYGEKLFAIRSR